MDSAWVIAVAPSAYWLLRQEGEPPWEAAAVVAVLSKLSILGVRLRNCSRVISELRHSAEAGAVPLAGVNGVMQVSARSVVRILVVVCKSFCA